MDVAVIDTGIANIASVLAGLRRAGAAPRCVSDADAIARAERVLLPGVGSFEAGMQRLEEIDVIDVLRERIERGAPLLAICLGLQLLCARSDESPGVAGLGVIARTVSRFDDDLIVPQMGFNLVVPSAECALLEEGYAYYANSYRLATVPDGWHGATSVHGAPFVAGLERGRVLACQFHPELSGAWGARLLQRWLAVPLGDTPVGDAAC
jgi:imidazole glycerol phosphate synthase glutamine amidotransferase subunit